MQGSGLGIWIIDDRFFGSRLAYYLLKGGYRVGYSHSLKAAVDALTMREVDGLTIPTEIFEVQGTLYAAALFSDAMFEVELPERERLSLRRDADNIYRLPLKDIALVIFHTGTEPLRKTEKEGLSAEQILEWNRKGANSVVEKIKESDDKVCVAYSALNYNQRFIEDVRSWGFDGIWDVFEIVDGIETNRITSEHLVKGVEATLKAASEGRFIEVRVGWRRGGIETIYHTFREGRIKRERW